MSEERFPAMDMAQANNECRNRRLQQRDKCPKCDSPVLLHCGQCKVQVTGCICTEVDRFGSSAERIKEIFDKQIEMVGEDEARRRMQQAGFWIPPSARNN